MDVTAEDLRAFEKRLTEIVNQLQPSMWRYRILLIVLIITTIFGAWMWLSDPQTAKLSFYDSLIEHMFFSSSCLGLIVLFLFGIHKRIVASSVLTSRCRSVLCEYNMSCDDDQSFGIQSDTTPDCFRNLFGFHKLKKNKWSMFLAPFLSVFFYFAKVISLI